MKTLKMILGAITAFVLAIPCVNTTTVEAYSYRTMYDIDFSCGSEKFVDGAQLTFEFKAGELVAYVGINDNFQTQPCDYCFGSMIIDESNESYSIQYTDKTVGLYDNGYTYEVWCENDERNTSIDQGFLFSVWFDHWGVGDTLIFDGYSYTLTPELTIERHPDITGLTTVDNFYFTPCDTVEVLPNPSLEESTTVVEPITEQPIVVTEPIMVTEPTTEYITEVTEPITEAITNPPMVVIEPTEPTVPTTSVYDSEGYLKMQQYIEASKDYTKQITRQEYMSEFRVVSVGPYYLYGDANLDGVVNLTDVVSFIRFMTDDGTLPLAGIANMDSNESGGPDVYDVINLMYYVKE